MAIRLDLLEHLGDLPVGADEECRPADSHVLAVHELLLSPHPVQLAHFLVLVGQEGEGEIEFLLESGVRARRVGADPQNDRPGAPQAKCFFRPGQLRSPAGAPRQRYLKF